jgi:hypothetical protein
MELSLLRTKIETIGDATGKLSIITSSLPDMTLSARDRSSVAELH